MTNTGYLIYQAERPKTTAEQRRIDAAYGELSASVARVGALDHRVRARWRAHMRDRTRRLTASRARLPS